MQQRRFTIPAAAAMVAALALVGCGREDVDAGPNPARDTTTSRTEQQVDQAQASTERAVDNTKEAVAEIARDAKVAGQNAVTDVGSKVADARITTSVNAELAKDPQLSALRIDVDTAGGRVALRGTAPDPASRERATQLAMAVKGVVSVDNQLAVNAVNS